MRLNRESGGRAFLQAFQFAHCEKIAINFRVPERDSCTFVSLYSGAPRTPVGRARREPWVRKNGNPSMREILVKAKGMARGRVRVRLRPTAAYVAPDDIFI